jgi:SAM-dependent methyltransferase
MFDAVELAALARPAGKIVLEFGSGWNPVLPLIFRLAGATRVVLTDQERLLDRALVLQAIDAVGAEWSGIRDALGLPDEALDVLQVDRALSLPDLLTALGLSYAAPFDPAAIPAGSIDIVVSRAVLEHVPEYVLARILQNFRRILAPGGLMLHRIDMSDHWEHDDKSISRVNFLRYSDAVWRFTELSWGNVQNRLRRADYVKMFERAGLRDVTATGEPHGPSLTALRSLQVAPRFRGMPHQELAIIETTVSARA